MGIFKACDIRGRYPDDLNDALYGDLGRAIATILARRTATPRVLVAGDLRVSTPNLRAALIEGLVAGGCRVLDLGLAPTPVAYFAARRLRADGLAIVTASHNPPAFNGLKLCLGPMPITPEELAEVQRLVAERRFTTAASPGGVEPVRVQDDYVRWLCADAEPGRGLRVVLDCGNGSFSDLAPAILRKLDYQVVELFCEPDGRFPNRPPNPALPENLGALRKAVVEAGAAAGLAFDGDGDRLALVDERGRSLTGDEAIILLARHTLGTQAEGEKVVCDIKCSRAVLDAVAATGAEPLLEKSGHAFIKTRMITERARFGGELSGHFFYRELAGGDDALFSALRVCELIRQAGSALSDLVDAMPHYHTSPDIRIPYDAPDGPARLEQLAAAADGRIVRLDGVRVEYPDGWALARCSVTEPLLTFRFESYDGSPLSIAERFLAPAPDLREAVVARLAELEGKKT